MNNSLKIQPVMSYVKTESRVKELAELVAVTIPDGSAILQKLFPAEFLPDKATETAVLKV